MPSNVLITGAVGPECTNINEEFTYVGLENGKPRYEKPSGDSGEIDYIVWRDDYTGTPKWVVRCGCSGTGVFFQSEDDVDVDYPWQVQLWLSYDGSPGTVTEVPDSTEPTFGLPADIVAFITSRFGTVANFLRLRNQGQV